MCKEWGREGDGKWHTYNNEYPHQLWLFFHIFTLVAGAHYHS